MEFKKCSRCGNFFVSDGNICPKCSPKDNLELCTFKNYIEQNGMSSIDVMSTGTGISAKNLNRFLNIEGLNYSDKKFNDNEIGNTSITLN